jgi:hypothetical protein
MLYDSPECLLTDILNDNIDYKNITLGQEFKILFKVVGENWDGKLDYRAAQLILSAQKDFLNLLSSVSGKKYTLSSKEVKNLELRIPVKINTGSLEALLDYTEPVLGVLKMLPSAEQTCIFITLIIAMFGYFSFKDHNKTKNELAEKIYKTEENKIKLQQAMSHDKVRIEEVHANKDCIESILSTAEKFLSPLRCFNRFMKDEDVLISKDKELSREEVRSILPTTSHDDYQEERGPFWTDDEFTIDVWNIKSSLLTIRDYNNNVLTPKISFLHNDDNVKFKTFLPTPSDTESKRVRFRLGISFDFEGKIINSFIVQINPPEDENPSLAELIDSMT